MRVSCSQALFELFPAASIHGVAFEQVERLRAETATEWQEQARASVQASGLQTESLTEAAAIKEWRKAYQVFGVKPSKYRSAVEQLYRRALKGEIIETNLPLVNLYCYVSLIHGVPMAGYDLQSVRGDITIRLSQPDEEFLAIGAAAPSKCAPGVVVYADEAGIICWAWNHRDAARTSLNAETRRAIFFADAATAESRPRAASAIASLSEILTAAGARQVSDFVLEQQASAAQLSA